MIIPMEDGSQMYLQQTLSDPGAWLIKDEEKQTVGFLMTYVDDLLIMGPQSVVQCTLDAIERQWECSPADRWKDET
jgi:hypothetical protein